MDTNNINETLSKYKESAISYINKNFSQSTGEIKTINYKGLIALLMGLIIALLLCLTAKNYFIEKTVKNKKEYATFLENKAPSFANINNTRELSEFTKANPFDTEVPKTTSQKYALSNFTLKGTLPHVGAWINIGSETTLVLLNQEIGGYTLEDVTYAKALLSQNGESYPLHLTLSGKSSRTTVANNSQAKQSLEKKGINSDAIIPAKDGQEGSIPSELVDKLLMDPYDEMAKMRMTPAKDGGLHIERIAPDSVLGLVGVERGDVVKSLNNIEISNLGDAANAVHSIMSGTRLDVTVIRGGKPVQLNYTVK